MASPTKFCKEPCRFFRAHSLLLVLACLGLAETLLVKVKTTVATPVSSDPSEACAYYVSPTGADTNFGSLQAPWKHLQKAFDTLTAGQVACLRTGTYEPAGTYNTPSYRQSFSRKGEPGKPIVIRNYPGEAAIIRGEVVVRGNYLKLLGTPPSGRLIFEGPLGPDASGVKGKGASQVWLDACHNIVLDHVEIRNNDHHAGLYVSNVSDVEVLGCYVHDNGRFNVDTDATGQHPVNVDQGIYWAASSGTNKIANCLLEHNRAFDLQLFAGSGRITGLTIVENTIVKAMNSGVLIGKGADGNVFAHNIVAMNSQQTNNKQIRLADDARNNLIDTNIAWHTTTALEGLDTSTLTGLGNVVRNFVILDPRFVDFLGSDYHLRPGSPAIGASLASGAEGEDIDGARRPSRPSLGAYEYKSPP
jgi:Right handed beta helix region